MWFIIGALVATAIFAYKPELAVKLNGAFK